MARFFCDEGSFYLRVCLLPQCLFPSLVTTVLVEVVELKAVEFYKALFVLCGGNVFFNFFWIFLLNNIFDVLFSL